MADHEVAPTSPRGWRTVRMALAAVALVGAAASGCASDGGDAHHHGGASSGPDLNGAPDAPVTGAQGHTPQFIVECPFSHAAADDPIVYPGQPGQSHMHLFFGNESADAFSTPESLLASTSQCDQRLDAASGWAPALYDAETMLTPYKSVAYYRPGAGVDPTSLQPYPVGLKVIAGNAGATAAQSNAVVAWTCGTGIARNVELPSCPTDRPLRFLVTFPDCWNGVDLDSENHMSHMAYSSGGACPTSHPVPVPQLQFSIAYEFSGDPAGLRLASGSVLTGHADFFNAWQPAELADEIANCLHRKVVCGITSGRD